MTHLHITNADNTTQNEKYYIEIEGVNLEFDHQNNMQNLLEVPKNMTPTDQAAQSQTFLLDFQKRASVVTITGRIDKWANRASNWSAVEVHDTSVVRKRMQYMWDRGGTNKIIIGKGDNYYNRANTATEDETWEGVILKINFKESSSDHEDRPDSVDSENYPSGVTAKVAAYDVTIAFRMGTRPPINV